MVDDLSVLLDFLDASVRHDRTAHFLRDFDVAISLDRRVIDTDTPRDLGQRAPTENNVLDDLLLVGPHVDDGTPPAVFVPALHFRKDPTLALRR